MNKKGQQIEQEEGHGQVVLAVAEVVFDVIALVFKGIKALIFNFPAGTAAFDQIDHVVFGDLDIGDPTVVVSALVVNKETVLEKINVVGCAV